MDRAVDSGAVSVSSRRPRHGHLAVAVLVFLTAVLSAAMPALAAQYGAPGSYATPGGSPPAAVPTEFGFRCGGGYCDTRTQYCETIKTDAPELPSDYSCQPLPRTCRTKLAKPSNPLSCDCFPQKTRCDFCTVISGAVYRTCVGGK
jgi:hypothetical protein